MVSNIFAYFIPRVTDTKEDKQKKLAYSEWFEQSIPQAEFVGEEYLFYYFLSYANDIGIALEESYLKSVMDSDMKSVLIKSRIHVVGTEDMSLEDPFQFTNMVAITKQVILDEYNRLQNLSNISLADFVGVADGYFMEKIAERLSRLYNEGFSMMTRVAEKKVGVADALEFTETEAAKIKDIYDREKIKELVDMASDKEEDKEAFRFVTDCGLAPIDNDCGGIYTTQLFGIEADPGAGKTRFVLGMWIYQAATVHKRNVIYFALEQSVAEIEAMLVARHLNVLYPKYIISDSDIVKNKVDAEYLPMVKAARFDLFESGKYGKIHIVSTDLYLHSFINKIKIQDSLHGPFDLVVIDHMAIIDQETQEYRKALSDAEVIAKAYKLLKKYVRKSKKAGIAVNQLNREGTKLAKADKETDATSAAGGMNVYRNTDYNIVITATKLMEAQHKRRLATPKKRSSAGFDSVVVDVRLACCLYFVGKAKQLV